MKYLTLILLFAISTTAKAQSYGDSTITLTLTQRAAWWIGKHISERPSWDERNAPTALRPAIGTGTRPDSVFTATLKAKYILNALESLISQPLQVAYADYRSIVLNTPSVSGYSGLATQVNNIANGSSAQKQTATWLRDKYNERVEAYNALYTEGKNNVIEWSRN